VARPRWSSGANSIKGWCAVCAKDGVCHNYDAKNLWIHGDRELGCVLCLNNGQGERSEEHYI
jgi:hypothetical protein